jgi:sugar fermentation stimulation protein A
VRNGEGDGKQPIIRRVSLEHDPSLKPGRLIRRYKRFLADVDLDGVGKVTVHCPNSGSMLGLLEPGARVYCAPATDPKRRTAYTWQMVRAGRHWVGINTLDANRLALRAARKGALELFQGAREVRPEVKTGPHTRLDLMLQRPQGPLYVEVKNVTLVQGGVARFPDAVTTRGSKHLEELMRLKAEGAGAAMLYVVQRADAKSFEPAGDIDPGYARLYHQARRKGVKVVAAMASVSPQRVTLRWSLPLAG